MSSKVNLLDLAASAVAATVAAARPIRELSSDKHARLKGDGSVVTDADFSAQGAIMRTMQQVSGNFRIVGEESEEEMMSHLDTTAECGEEVYWLARQEVLMRYYNVEGRPPLSAEVTEEEDSTVITPPEDESEEDQAKYIVDADRVSVFVDPLDGTKSYARADYEYVTILIAIIMDNIPCFGVICKPFGIEGSPGILDTGIVAVYGGTLVNGVYIAGGEECQKPLRPEGDLPRAVISQSRSQGIVGDFVGELASSQVIHPEPIHVAGAGEKSLRLVMGTANEALWFFPKAGTSLWDVAASDALLRQLGGKLTDKFGRLLDYSKNREDAENSDGIIASNDASLHAECIKLFQEQQWKGR